MEKALSCTSSFVAGLSLCPLVVYMYFAFGKPPLLAPTRPFPLKRRSLRFRSRRKSTESCQVLLRSSLTMRRSLGVRKSCSTNVHLVTGLPAYPPQPGNNASRAPPLWANHRNGVVGVSDDPVGETYWKVKNGIRLSGCQPMRVSFRAPRCGR